MPPPSPNPSAAADFLRWYRPGGPWVLTAISPDKTGLETQTLSDEPDVIRFVQRLGPTHNIYFHVNPTMRALSSKASREDIRALDWLHVDIDPRPTGETDPERRAAHLANERERVLGLLTTRLPPGIPPPSAIVFSGGGYQGFWRLSDPMPINGQAEAYEEAKRFNKTLELAFGGDNCHNVDRIMRLPGTVNWPDVRKQKKGRVAALAEVVEATERVYSLSEFTPAPQVQAASLGFGASGVEVSVPGNVARVADLAELDQWGVPDRVKVIITQGNHPDEVKKGDNSRSAWIFDVVCNLVRCGVPDEVVFAILTDPDYAISSGILDKGANADRYALRQIQRAKEQAIDPVLREFNEQFAVVENFHGRCRVIEELWDPILKRPRLSRQSFDEFRNRHLHRYVELTSADGKVSRVPAGKWWLSHPKRRNYKHVVFDPSSPPDSDETYNLWRGFGVSPRAGDQHLAFLQHTREVICGGDERTYEYLINWLARLVQRPADPGEVAIVLRGGQGLGKGTWARWVMEIMGRHALHISDPSHLVGQFNFHLRDCSLLFADEAFYAGDKRHESILKTLITERSIMVEAKGVDAEQYANSLHIIMASNKQWVVPTNMDDRRYLVLEVDKAKRGDWEYFSRFADPQLRAEGAAALLHHLLQHDISAFNVRDVPKTAALAEQKVHSMSPEEDWWYNKLVNGTLLPRHDAWEPEVAGNDLHADYFNLMRDMGVQRRLSPTALGRFFKRVCPEGYPTSVQRMVEVKIDDGNGYYRTEQRRMRFYRFPDLEAARAQWERLFGFGGEWMDEPDSPAPGTGSIPF